MVRTALILLALVSAGEERDVEVTVVTDAAFRKHSDWSHLARGVIENETRDFLLLAGLRFRVVEEIAWEAPPDARPLEAILRLAAEAVGPRDGITAVFLGTGPPAECPGCCGFSHIGRPALLVVYPVSGSSAFRISVRGQLGGQFRRQLGHVFGVPGEVGHALQDPIPRSGRSEDQESVVQILRASRGMRFQDPSPFAGCDLDSLRAVYTRLSAGGKLEPALLVNLGVAFYREGRDDAAREIYASALARQPGIIEANMGLAQCDLVLGDTASVRDRIAVLASKPLDPGTTGMLGILRLRTGEPAAAESLLTQAMAVYPDRFTFVFNRGIARFRMKRFAEAARDFEQAITLEERPEAWLNLGLARHALGEREAAIRAFSRCSELASEGEVRREALEFLDHLRP